MDRKTHNLEFHGLRIEISVQLYLLTPFGKLANIIILFKFSLKNSNLCTIKSSHIRIKLGISIIFKIHRKYRFGFLMYHIRNLFSAYFVVISFLF